MITIEMLKKKLNEIAPEAAAEAWDNCGMQIDLGKENAERILICLEITNAVIEEAKQKKVDFIITHHPLYFNAVKKIDNHTLIGKYTIALIEAGISVYASHTCFDKIVGGNNTKICEMLGLINPEPLFTGTGPFDYVGYTAEFAEEKTFGEVIKKVAHVLQRAPGELRYVGEENMLIKKIGVCSGAGAELVPKAAERGCALFITGDIRYHEAAAASETGMALIDAGHFGTEKIFAENMAKQLRCILEQKKEESKTEIFVSESDKNPFSFCLF